MNAYGNGQRVRLKATFKVDSTPTDPTTITLKVMDPSGNIDTYTYAGAQLTKESTGVYYYDLAPDEAGIWHYRFSSTGTVVSGSPDQQFECLRSVF